jgi:acid phosphatase
LKINTNNIDERLLLKQKGESSDKSSRRKAVTDRYDVLLHIGDNLRDFSEAFAAARSQPHDEAGRSIAIERRYARVDSAASRWGWDWFILPNPVYGEWEKLLGAQPKLKLHPTNMKLLER